jgi:hypothetical protein
MAPVFVDGERLVAEVQDPAATVTAVQQALAHSGAPERDLTDTPQELP